MMNTKSVSRWVALIMLAGLITRLYLVFSLRAWQDEIVSTWMTSISYLRIWDGADPVHTPLYYVLLKIWSMVSVHIVWLRLLTIGFFLVNCWLVYKLGKIIIDTKFAHILLFSYCFSGYFLVFDWQARMYTGVTLLMLATLVLIKRASNMPDYVLLAIASLTGLLFDYGYYWFFFPAIFVIAIWGFYTKKPAVMKIGFSMFSGLGIFALTWGNSFIKYLGTGLRGIAWLDDYVGVDFLFAFFTGSHMSSFFVFVAVLLMAVGLGGLRKRKLSTPEGLVFITSVMSLLLGVVVSGLLTPVLHARSLQVVGLMVIFLIARGMYQLSQMKSKVILIISVILVVFNFINHVNLIGKKPGTYMIQLSPWKTAFEGLDLRSGLVHVVWNSGKTDPTFYNGLKYFLDGNDLLPSIKREYVIHERGYPLEEFEKCRAIAPHLADAFLCDK